MGEREFPIAIPSFCWKNFWSTWKYVVFKQTSGVIKAPSDSKTFILNLSKHVLSEGEEAVLRKGLNFAVVVIVTWDDGYKSPEEGVL
jgi:hypothetical protein